MSSASPPSLPKFPHRRPSPKLRRLLISTLTIAAGLPIIGILLLTFALTVAYPTLPPLDSLTDYQPKMPLRIYTADNVLIGEFGEERRNLVRIQEIPDVMKKAVLAIEDNRFYQHSGVDYIGIARAALSNLIGRSRQGASTITQQVARNFFLTSEQTYKRKLYEVLLAWKIENQLTKDQILEIYMNQIYLGQRAFGFSSAAQIYFGKSIKDITIAEAAMLAGLAKAPSAFNPVANPSRARTRQQYILQRMRFLNYITQEQYEQARKEELKIKTDSSQFAIRAEYVAEMARMLIYDMYKDETYTHGLNVYTTIMKDEQVAAYQALRQGVMAYEQRYGYRGPEGYILIPPSKEEAAEAIESELADRHESDDMVPAIVLEATPKQVRAVLASGREILITGTGLNLAKPALFKNTASSRRIRRGAIIRVVENEKQWAITQMPQVEAAFVAINTDDGAIRALVGGFDFNRNKFNHVTQAWRQPGSSLKPFIYSSSLEKGISPATIVSDSPVSFSAEQTGGQPWEPKNYDNKYSGLMTMRNGLTYSKNMVSIRILNKIGPKYAQEYISRFGFDPARNPPFLTMALGAGAATPLQMVTAYSVFANGGYKINPYLISRITDAGGKVLSEAQPGKAGDEALRVIDERNAFIMDDLLKDVTKRGTGARAGRTLARPDIAGKTGTTNDSHDAWFAGYQRKIAGVAWIGYDQPKNLGARETGGGVALPIWIGYMQAALKDMPVETRPTPKGIAHTDGEYHYVENPPGTGVHFIAGDERMLPPSGDGAGSPSVWGGNIFKRVIPFNVDPRKQEEKKGANPIPWRSLLPGQQQR